MFGEMFHEFFFAEMTAIHDTCLPVPDLVHFIIDRPFATNIPWSQGPFSDHISP
jgi:hypothetical protein